MTTPTGMLQFSSEASPDPTSGYTLDDNARALMIALFMEENSYHYVSLYLNYLKISQREDGSWCNFLLNGIFYPDYDSEDSIGRATLACCLATLSDWSDIRLQAARILQRALPHIQSLSSPRAVAYALLGLSKMKHGILPEKIRHELISRHTDYLIGLYQKQKDHNWYWFEQGMSYCNAILPQSLFSVYASTGDKRALKTAHETMNFLNSVLFDRGYLNIIGNEGWLQKGCTKALYDQQPVDAASVALACWEAYESIGRTEYRYLAEHARQWYHGKNINQCKVYNQSTGGCHDALTREGVNANQGAEAVLSFLLTELMAEGKLNQKSQRVQTS